jgi:hypothetical protein
MMSTLADEVSFILSEIGRFSTMDLEQIGTLSREDLGPLLPHPRGRGELMCGHAAAEKIEGLAKDYLASHRLSGRLAAAEVVVRFGAEPRA